MRTLAASVVLVVLCATALAQKIHPDFQKEYDAGVDAYRLGHYDEARTHLEAAKALEPTLPGPWRFLAAVAQAEGKWPECVESAREAIRLNPQSREIAATREVHDKCREGWGKPAYTGDYDDGTGAISVTADQAGAAVEINGLAYGATPTPPRTLAIGEVEVTVSKAGFVKASRKVLVLPAIVTDVDVALEVDPDAVKVDIKPPVEVTAGWLVVETGTPGAEIRIDGEMKQVDAQGRYQLEGGSHEVEIRAPAHEPQLHTVRVSRGQLVTVRADLRAEATVAGLNRKGYYGVGAGVGLLVVGGVAAILSNRAGDRARDWAELERGRPTGVDTEDLAPIHTRAEIEDEVATQERFALISNIAYGVGVVAIGVGAYFLVKGRPRGERRVKVAPMVSSSGGGLLGEVRW
jgi:hypothetical protein